MTDSSCSRAVWRILLGVAATAWLAACGGNPPPAVPAGNTAPDQFLFQRATDAMMQMVKFDIAALEKAYRG